MLCLCRPAVPWSVVLECSARRVSTRTRGIRVAKATHSTAKLFYFVLWSSHICCFMITSATNYSNSSTNTIIRLLLRTIMVLCYLVMGKQWNAIFMVTISLRATVSYQHVVRPCIHPTKHTVEFLAIIESSEIKPLRKYRRKHNITLI